MSSSKCPFYLTNSKKKNPKDVQFKMLWTNNRNPHIYEGGTRKKVLTFALTMPETINRLTNGCRSIFCWSTNQWTSLIAAGLMELITSWRPLLNENLKQSSISHHLGSIVFVSLRSHLTRTCQSTLCREQRWFEPHCLPNYLLDEFSSTRVTQTKLYSVTEASH